MCCSTPIAPSSVTGECFNLLSEEVATQLAIKLGADKLIGFCSEQGVIDDNGNAVAELFPIEAEHVIKKLTENTSPDSDYHSGTLRFLNGSIAACRAGVPRSHLISYKVDGALIQELFSFDGIGTQVVMASAEQVRGASIDDIGGILELIRPLEEQGVLVRRSREQLEQEIGKFTMYRKRRSDYRMRRLVSLCRRTQSRNGVCRHPSRLSRWQSRIVIAELYEASL